MKIKTVHLSAWWIAIIFLNSLLGRQLYNAIQAIGGWRLFLGLIALLSLICIRHSIRFIRRDKYLEGVGFILLGTISCFILELPEERVHVLLFGFLGFLLGTHSALSTGKWLALGLTVGILDEGIQALLPYRVGDIRDIIINTLSLLLGAIVALRCGTTVQRCSDHESAPYTL